MEILEEALNAYTAEDNADSIKAGLKESLFWLLLETAAKKARQQKMQLMQNWVHGIIGAEEESFN